MFNLLMLGLLMCRGDVGTKGRLLFDLIMQMNKEKNVEKRILYWNHPRLRKAIRMLVYVSEVLPKKHKVLLSAGVGSLKISEKQYGTMDEEIK